MAIISKWIDKIAQYMNVRIRSLQLSIVERSSAILSYFAFTLIMLFIGFAILLFLGFGVAEVFTALVDSRIGGFFLTVASYVLIMLIVFLFRKSIIKGFASIFIKILTNDDDEDDEKEELI